MKYSLVVLALLGHSQAIKLTDDDLFSDDKDANDTLASIKQAEKEHGSHFTGISKEDMQSLVTQKSTMTFKDDEFVRNQEKKDWERKEFVQIDEQINIDPQARPIGQMLAQIGYDEHTVLQGQGLNDEDDVNDTLASIKSAEYTMGVKMPTPAVKRELYEVTGTKVENILAGNSKIDLSMIEEGVKTKEEEVEHVSPIKKLELTQKKEEKKNALNQMSSHQRAFD